MPHLLALEAPRATPYLAGAFLRGYHPTQLLTRLKKKPFPGLAVEGNKVVLADAAAQQALVKRLKDEIERPKGADEF